MTEEAKRAVRQILVAANAPNFLGLPDGERLVRIIEMAFRLGKRLRRSRQERRAT